MSQFVYSLLRGRVSDAKAFGSNPNQRPHYHLRIEAASASFDVAINIASEDPHVQDVKVLYAVKNGIQPATAQQLANLGDGITNLPQGSPLRLDYVSNQLVRKQEMSLLPLYDPHAADNGEDDIMSLVDLAVGDPDIRAYVFGHRYRPNPHHPTNDAWGFAPDDGVHNIHMNQGNFAGNHDNENGRHQDGALWLHFANTDSWSAVYVAFQTQSWHNKPNGFPANN